MSMLQENPSVIVKRKNIQDVLEYCLENRIACKLTPRDMPEEWELEFTVDEIMKAINLGMFLREHKLELAGLGNSTPAVKTAASVAPRATRKKSEKEDTKKVAAKTTETDEPVSIFKEATPADDFFEDSKQEENLFM